MSNVGKKKESEYEGKYRAANRSFGFVKIFNDEEIYVHVKDSLNAMNDDKVIVKIIKEPKGKSREGKIIKIVERMTDEIVGIFKPNKNFAFVVPINNKIPFDIHIDKKFFKKAVRDSVVVCKLLKIKTKANNPEGAIIEVLGHKDDPNVVLSTIVKDFNIKDVFDDETLAEADKVPSNVLKKDIKGRVDLRDKFFITIDGVDTKDIDDAVYLEDVNDDEIKLYVSIADVSHYVKENSALDREALKRGNSVYLLDRVIPMFPHSLSNGICSLNEGEDRLAMTVEMLVNNKGKVVKYDIYESVINSHKRMTYEEVQSIYDNANDDKSRMSELNKMIMKMFALSKVIRNAREKRGAINFDLKETYIEVDEELKPLVIKEKERLLSHLLIEDFMVLANSVVAEDFYNREVPFLYRTHEACEKEKLENLKNVLVTLNVPFNIKKTIKPKDIQSLLISVKDKPYRYIVESIALRAMTQARYTKKLIGHFALALKYYTHFTSPIRRYNDLQIHRIMKEVLHNEFTEKRIKHYDKILDDVALNISRTERLAIDCERDVEKLKKCEYMQNYLGEEYEGIVSGLTNFGIFVMLSNTVEGMIPLRDIRDDYYEFDENTMRVIGKRRHRVIAFGDKLTVQLVRVVPDMRIIDFGLVKKWE